MKRFHCIMVLNKKAKTGGTIMKIRTSLYQRWHRFFAQYNQTLIHSCIDEREQIKLQKKVDYHQYQLLRNSL